MTAQVRVLLIDDDERVRETLESELSEEGASGGDGLRWLVKSQGFDDVEAALINFRPDMVVLDLVEGEVPHEVDSGNPVVRTDMGNLVLSDCRLYELRGKEGLFRI